MFSPVKLPTLQRRSHLCEINQKSSAYFYNIPYQGPVVAPSVGKLIRPPSLKKTTFKYMHFREQFDAHLGVVVVGVVVGKEICLPTRQVLIGRQPIPVAKESLFAQRKISKCLQKDNFIAELDSLLRGIYYDIPNLLKETFLGCLTCAFTPCQRFDATIDLLGRNDQPYHQI